MPRLKHFYGRNHLHYLTANTYRKARIFESDRYKRKLAQTLDDLRTELSFRIVGYVLIRQPTDSHLLIWPGSLPNPSQIMQKLSERTANFILRNPREEGEKVSGTFSFEGGRRVSGGPARSKALRTDHRTPSMAKSSGADRGLITAFPDLRLSDRRRA
jgi:REP element-mobilizing transposase RayT